MAKRLMRSTSKKMLGGVCAGMANYFDLDVSLVRLIFVAVSLVTALVPMGIFYLIAWIVIPDEETPAPAPPEEDQPKKPSRSRKTS